MENKLKIIGALSCGILFAISLLIYASPGPSPPNLWPIADAGPDQEVDVGETVILNGSGSIDYDGYIVSYKWDFDASDGIDWDNPDAEGMVVTTTYLSSGTYIVTLQVTDDDGAKDIDNCTIVVRNVPPIADFYFTPSMPSTYETIYFFDNSTDIGGYIVNWTWDFGDGNISYEQNPIHQYANDGIYNVTLTVIDNEGALDSITKQIVILNSPPIADANGPYYINEGDSVTLNASASYDEDGFIVQWQWDLNNDGTYDLNGEIITVEWNELKTYGIDDDGSYTIRLKVIDNDGAFNETKSQIIVNNIAPTIIPPSNISGNEGSLITIGTTFFVDPGNDTFTASINWGDGYIQNIGVVSENIPPQSHIYKDDGTYTITILVTDDDGGTGIGNLYAIVNNIAPTISNTPDKQGYEGEEIIFVAGNVNDPGNDSFYYRWDFNNDGIWDTIWLSTNTASYTWNDDYNGIVKVQVKDDDDGIGNIDICNVTVLNKAPTKPTDIEFIPSSIQVGDELIAIASGSTDVPTDTITYYYKFYDVTTSSVIQDWSTDNSIIITADMKGHEIRVYAKAIDEDGGESLPYYESIFVEQLPIADANGPYYINEGDSVTLNASASYDEDGFIVQWQWDLNNDGTHDLNGEIITVEWNELKTYGIDDDGSYTIRLKVIDNNGTSNEDTSQIIVNNIAPTISNTPDKQGYEGEEIIFVAGNVNDPGNDSFYYRWDFNNDGIWDTIWLSTNTASYTWNDDYNGIVRVQVKDDDDGIGNIDICNVTVLNKAPTKPTDIEFIPSSIQVGDELIAIASGSTDVPTDTITYYYKFYDVTTSSVIQDWSTDNSIIITADMKGHEIRVYAKAIDEDGGESLPYYESIFVEQLPIADANGPYYINEGDSVTLNASASYDEDGFIVQWQWDLNNDGTHDLNGEIITVEWNELKTYGIDDDGSYTIRLKVIDNNGTSNEDTSQIIVNNIAPTISNTPDKQGYEGEEIIFVAGNVNDPGNDSFYYRWDFNNDGIWDTIWLSTNTASYTWNDDYNGIVRVQVKDDDDGIGNIDICNVTVLNKAPTKPTDIEFIPSSIQVGDELIAIASGSTDVPTDTITYYYKFYDVTTSSVIQDWSTDNSIIITADMKGHEIRVYAKAIDEDGGESLPYYESIFVEQLPIADANGPYYINEGDSVTLNASASYDEDGFIVQWQWDLNNDGTHDLNGEIITVEWNELKTYGIDDDGSYTIRLKVIDNNGTSNEDTSQIIVNNIAPTISNTPDKQGYEGEEIIFVAGNVNDPGNDSFYYRWDFNNDGIWDTIWLSTNTASYTWNDDYNGIVRVQVKDDDDGIGNIDICNVTVLNKAPTKPTDIEFIPSSIQVGDELIAIASGSTDVPTDTITYYYKFYDVTTSSVIQDWSTDNSIIITADMKGHEIRVYAKAIDEDGGESLPYYESIFVLNTPPIANFIWTPITPSPSEIITFNASLSYDPDGFITQWIWDFGDGTFAYGEIVSHEYKSSGHYNVVLTVIDNDGATATITKEVVITLPPCANFTYKINGKVITFNASLSYDPDGFITQWIWDFGDGTFAYGEIVSHEYKSSGYYNVVLTVIDNDGATATTNKSIFIDCQPPSTQIILTPSSPNGRNGWYVSNITIQFVANDDISGVKKTYYRIDGGSWNEVASPIILGDGIHTVEFYSIDNAGNEEFVKSIELKIDSSPPSAQCIFSANATNEWFNQILNISLEAFDNISGIKEIYYRVDGGEYLHYNDTFAINEGMHVLEYFAIDNAGNTCPLQRKEINIDLTPPIIKFNTPYNGIYLFGRKICSASQTIVIGAITIEAYSIDNLSGIKEIKLYIDGSFIINSSLSTLKYEWNEFAIGYHEIKLVAYDKAGNYKTMKESIFIINLKWS